MDRLQPSQEGLVNDGDDGLAGVVQPAGSDVSQDTFGKVGNENHAGSLKEK